MASRSQGTAPEVVGYDPQFPSVGSPQYPGVGSPHPGAGAPAPAPAPSHTPAAPARAVAPVNAATVRTDVPPRIPGGEPAHEGAPWEEWNPSEDEATRPLRGKHRVARQRTGGVARGGAVLGVGMIAAVGAGGMATAHDKDPGAVSVPDLDSATDTARGLADQLSDLPDLDAEDLPGVGGFFADGSDSSDTADGSDSVDGTSATDASPAADGSADAGEALRARILAQADRHRSAADAQAREEAAREAASSAAAQAAKRAAAEERARAEAHAERQREAAEAAEAEKRKAAERRAERARGYTAPLASYQLSAGFGQSGGRWQSDHTGQDFAAPNGTPVKAIHTGTVQQAGWAGSYGYRVVLKLDDGTQLWFCHLSSMTKSAGDKVSTGDVIGRVGSTGNSTGPHLHVEVRPDGSTPVDPLPWLRDKGVHV